MWEPAPGGGRSTTLFTRRLDPWRPELWSLGRRLMELQAEVEREAPIAAASRTDVGQMNLREARAALADAATRYLWLLDKGRKRPAGLPPDRTMGELSYEDGEDLLRNLAGEYRARIRRTQAVRRGLAELTPMNPPALGLTVDVVRAPIPAQLREQISLAALEAGRRSQPWLLPPPGAAAERDRAPKGPRGIPIPSNPSMRKNRDR